MSSSAAALTSWIASAAGAAGAQGTVVPLDRTLASSIVARLCVSALPGGTLAIGFADAEDAAALPSAEALASRLGVPCVSIDARAVAALLERALADVPMPQAPAVDQESGARDLARRIRMTAAYAVAARRNALVAGALTRDDLATGQFTRFGDAGVDLLPLAGTLRRDLRTLALDAGIPRDVIEALTIASAGVPLAEQSPAVPPSDLARYLELGPEGVPPATALRIERLMRSSRGKLDAPLVPDSATTDSGFPDF